jgi:hypothetical protein
MDQFKQKQTYELVKKLLLKWKRRWSKDSGQSNEKEKTKKKKKTNVSQPKWACQICNPSNKTMISQQNAKKKKSWSPTPNKSNVDEWICFKKSIKKKNQQTRQAN